MNANDKDKDFLLGHAYDLLQNARDGIPCHTLFLNGGEIITLKPLLDSKSDNIVLCGGYDDAERRMAFFLPDYMPCESEIAGEYIESELYCVNIKTSGYEKLNHSSFLGALTGIGIDRTHLGDILIEDENSAYVFCDETIHSFLLSDERPLDSVGRDKVRVVDGKPGEDYDYSKHFTAVSDTIASTRLDCVVGALCNFSREKAESAITSGLVVHNYHQELRKSAEVKSGDIISVRAHGKYKIESVDSLTKKGRLRLIAKKYN